MSRLARLFRRRRLDRELAGEIQAHIDEKADELMESGMGHEQALREARAHFGNSTALLEQSREVWRFMMFENFARDLRLGARALRRNPLFTAVAAVTLALGIGANTAIFSLIDAVLLRPLPFPESNRIVMLWEVPPPEISPTRENPVSPRNFLDWRDRTHSFQDMSAISNFPMGLSGFGEPREVEALRVSASFFRILGVRPLLGRTFDDSEDVPDGPRLAVLSYGLWQEQFGGDRSIVGRSVNLHDQPYRIIGVMPQGFDVPFEHAEIWVPGQYARGTHQDEGRYLHVIAKLRHGVSMAQAESDLAGVARQIAHERPMFSRNWTTNIVTVYQQMTGDVRTALLILFAAVTFVLLIAAGNVANLLLMRGTQRQREIAVRAALGASRRRIAGQLLAESLLLSIVGSVVGIGLAMLGVRGIVAALPAFELPRAEAVHIDARVLAFSMLLCVVTTFLFGLAPAIAFSRTDPDDALKQSSLRSTSGRGRRTRSALVVMEVALSLVLLAGAGLLARSFLNELSVARGFRTDHILSMRMFFSPALYYDDKVRARYLSDVLDRVRANPGVQAASSAHFLPMTGNISGSCFTRKDRPEPAPGTQPTSDYLIVSPDYFRVMGIPVLRGRDFNAQDRMGAQVRTTEGAVIINERFARVFFPGEDPIGKRLSLCWNVEQGTIVGVVADARHKDLAVAPVPTIYLDQAQTPMYFAALVVRTALPPGMVAHDVEQAVHAVNPHQAISHVETMEQVQADSVARPRLESALLGIFAAIAVVLALIGLYGVLAYSVTQRTREIGIRMALGANSGQLVNGVIRDGLRLIVPGIVVGVAASLVLTRLMRSLLYGVKPADPLTFASVCGLLIVVGLVASWLPARRAAAVDPVGSLRWE